MAWWLCFCYLFSPRSCRFAFFWPFNSPLTCYLGSRSEQTAPPRCLLQPTPKSAIEMASNQGEIPGNYLIFTYCNSIFTVEKDLKAYLFASLISVSAGVWNIIWTLRSVFVSNGNNSTEYQLWRANGGPNALASSGHVCQHLVERPRDP